MDSASDELLQRPKNPRRPSAPPCAVCHRTISRNHAAPGAKYMQPPCFIGRAVRVIPWTLDDHAVIAAFWRCAGDALVLVPGPARAIRGVARRLSSLRKGRRPDGDPSLLRQAAVAPARVLLRRDPGEIITAQLPGGDPATADYFRPGSTSSTSAAPGFPSRSLRGRRVCAGRHAGQNRSFDPEEIRTA